MTRTRAPLALFLGAPLALVACGPQQLETGIAPNASYSPLALPAQVFADNDAVIAHFVGTTGRSSASESRIGDYPGDAGDQLLVFSADDLEDDSVAAMQWRVLVKDHGAGVRVANAGVRQRCARSGSREWTTALCP